MKHRMLVVLSLLALTSLTGCGFENLPTDQQLRTELETNRDSYQQVVDGFLSKGLYRLEVLSDGGLSVRPNAVDANGLSELEKSLRDDIKIDLVKAISRKGTEYLVINEVTFFNYRRGMVFAGETKGLAYVIDEQGLFVTIDLDNVDKANTAIYGQRLYRFLEPNWYIFYEYST